MAKVKFSPKEFLLRRGEYLVMGVSGFFLALMLIWGASMHGTAMDPGKESQKLVSSTKQIYQNIETGSVDSSHKEKLAPPAWVTAEYKFRTPPASAFAQAKWPIYDPTGQPSTKRDNPVVLPIGPYQVDLVKSAMLGYDIIYDAQNEPLIAVLTTKEKGSLDEGKLKDAAASLRNAVTKNKAAQQKLQQQQKNPAPKGGTGFPGGMGFPPGDPGGEDAGPGPGGRGAGFGFGGGEFNQSAQRVEQAIEYIPLKEIDEAVKAGKRPALTVIPLRLVTVHAAVPYKKQLDEIKRALRLPNPPPTAKKEAILQSDMEAKRWGPYYDGFEVQRKVSRVMPDGTLVVIEDWPTPPADPKDTSGNYLFEEKYIDRINTRSIANHFDEGYIPYFLKPDMMLSMPLPQLTKELNVKYPDIKIKEITDNIDKLKKANQKEIPPSELAKKLAGLNQKSDLYKAKTADNLKGFGFEGEGYGPTIGSMKPGMGKQPPGIGVGMPPGLGMGMPAGPGYGIGSPKYPEGYSPEGGNTMTVADEVDNFLLRFVDCDVKPGYIYEYRIRLRMVNPNYGQKDLVANPEYAKEDYKILYSAWLRLDQRVTVPAESFLYAHDVQAYREMVNKDYPPQGTADSTTETRALNSLLQAKDNQAVVQVATWMEQVRAGEGSKREPVGTWVVAEMPVGRGDYIGRKQYVKLPLWSSETEQYVLREVGDKLLKGKYQPKGWMVDFATRSVLVDFEGGKVKTRANVFFDAKGNLATGGRYIDEEAATEMLIVREDGKLVVRNSSEDEADPNRKSIVSDWTKWVEEVAKRKTTSKVDPMNPFGPPGGFNP